MTEPTSTPATYAGAGVDIDAGEEAVDRIRPLVASTLRPEVLGGLGDFGGLFAVDTEKYSQPVLVACTDGVGTKAVIAQACGRYDTIGIDLVAMCVDDLVCQGAEPLFFLDYISTGAVDPTQMTELVAGVADGCRQVGAALLGGEMAEHAGVMKPGEFDLVGFAVGVVEREKILGSGRVRDGDILLGLPSPGLRSNGYTLARHVLLERAGLALDAPAWEGATTSVADELLLPSVLYTPAVLSAIADADVHAVVIARHGIAATFVDPFARSPLSVRQWLGQVLDFIAEDVDALGCQPEIARLSAIVSAGTSADRQIDIFSKAKAAGRRRLTAIKDVIDWAAVETQAF